MLVLRRKMGQRLVIAGVITISVLAVEGDRVKLGIIAPPHIPIVREEVLPGDREKMPYTESSDNQCTS